MDNNVSALREQAWDYFAAHSSQRITTFNFYIVLASVTSTTYFSSFKADSNLQDVRPALAALLVLFSFVFWSLDRRNRFLIKNAESALMIFESESTNVDPRTKLFSLEANAVSPRLRGFRRLAVWKWALSYSDCFNLVFLIFASIGVFDLGKEAFHLMR